MVKGKEWGKARPVHHNSLLKESRCTLSKITLGSRGRKKKKKRMWKSMGMDSQSVHTDSALLGSSVNRGACVDCDDRFHPVNSILSRFSSRFNWSETLAGCGRRQSTPRGMHVCMLEKTKWIIKTCARTVNPFPRLTNPFPRISTAQLLFLPCDPRGAPY